MKITYFQHLSPPSTPGTGLAELNTQEIKVSEWSEVVRYERKLVHYTCIAWALILLVFTLKLI